MRSNARSLASLVGAMMVAMLMVGCSSSAQTPSMGVAPSGTHMAPTQNQFVAPDAHDNCEDPGGLHVRPCRVLFNANNPGPTNVLVRRDNREPGRIAETDNCATKGVATITRAGHHMFTVTAGATDGTCTAHFSFENETGTLRVINRL
jgi:hypothetical protein